ncbi:MAG TPA: 2'-5' RNA ligase family protein [Anaerolineaceae bacterium]|nr:2'-5' RNA ligase family protein [Anaerolineaceae bacterium]HQH86157.1 2'-5' RNA ligase family protein [Anaerolineaceae bacterium]
MYFCIAGLLDDVSQNEIRKKALRILRQYGLGVTALLLPQHVSLKISFSTDRVDDLVDYFGALCLKHRPVQVDFQNLEVVAVEDRGAKSGVLWYNARENNSLRKIHNQMNNDLPPLLGIVNSSIDGDGFRFHSTIAYGQKTYEEYRKIHAAIACEFEEISTRIDKVAIFCCVEDAIVAGKFFTYKIAHLT